MFVHPDPGSTRRPLRRGVEHQRARRRVRRRSRRRRGCVASGRQARTACPSRCRSRRGGRGSRGRWRTTASSWSSAFTVSKNPKSFGGIVLNVRPVPSTNVVSGTVGRGRGERTASEDRADARARSAWRVRVDLERRLDGRDGRRGIGVLHERPAEHQHAVRARVADEEATFGERSVVAGRDQEELAARATVGPGRPKSMIHWNHMSSNVPSAIGGVSTTIGPSFRSTNHDVVDGVGVRGQERATTNPSAPRRSGTVLSSTPTRGSPAGSPGSTRPGTRSGTRSVRGRSRDGRTTSRPSSPTARRR